MKFIHLADIHASRERYDSLKPCLERIVKEVEEQDIAGIFIAGDFWDSTITNTEASHFMDYFSFMQKLQAHTDVFMTYGTPSHEPAGSLEIFNTLDHVHLIGRHYHPSVKLFVVGGHHKGEHGHEIEVVAIPEPRLSMIDGNTIEDKYKAINDSYEQVIHEVNIPNKASPRIVMFHGLVGGMKMQNGTVIPDGNGAISLDQLKRLNADYYALGHVHMPQELGHGMNGGYCGSMAPINFGEDHTPCFWEFELGE